MTVPARGLSLKVPRAKGQWAAALHGMRGLEGLSSLPLGSTGKGDLPSLSTFLWG